MFFLIRAVLSIFTFWLPLLFSAKALLRPDQNLHFLLTYWLLYALMANIQYYLRHVQTAVPFVSLFVYLGDFINTWMFYSHGCLVLSNYYIPGLFGGGVSGSYVIDTWDLRVFDPVVKTLVVKNGFFQNFLGLFPARFLPIDDLIAFNHQLCHHFELGGKRLSFLQFGVDYFCYIDTPNELHVRYLRCRRFLLSLACFGQPPRRRRRAVLKSQQPRPMAPRPEATGYVNVDMDFDRRSRSRANSTGLRRSGSPSPRMQRSQSPPVHYMSPENSPRMFAADGSGVHKYGGLMPRRGEEILKPRAVSGPDPTRVEAYTTEVRPASFSAGSPPYPVVSEYR